MALPDSEINTVLDLFNQKCIEDPDFSKLAQENPMSAFDLLAREHETRLDAEHSARFPFPVPGQVLTMEELTHAKAAQT